MKNARTRSPPTKRLKGILSSVYWKPTIVWIIDKVRVMKAIKTQTRSAKPVEIWRRKFDLSIYTYLSDVEYQVQAHFEWNFHREDMAKDRNENKHYFIAKRMIERGGRRDVFLGTRECQGYVEPCKFGEGEGFYDNYGELSFDLMFHGFDYPDEIGKNEFHSRFWRPKMINGVVEFIRPEECTIRKFVRPMKANPPLRLVLRKKACSKVMKKGALNMSWIQKLYETYNNCQSMIGADTERQ